MVKETTVNIIGLGQMGQRHLKAALKNNYKIVGLCDLRPELLNTLKNDYDLSTTALFTDAKELIKKQNADCLVIATTADMHYDLTVESSQAGTEYILCEKPMTTSLMKAVAMVDICAKNKSRLAVNHSNGFSPFYNTIRRVIDDGKIGDITSINIIAGNFGLAMNGSHYLHICKFLTGEYPTKIACRLSKESLPNPRGEKFIDRAGSVWGVTATGKRFYLEAGSDQGHGIHLIIAGTQGMIYADQLSNFIRINARDEKDRHQPSVRYAMPSQIEEISAPVSDLVEMTAAMQKSLIAGVGYFSGQEGCDIVSFLVCMHYSHENNNIFVSPEGLPENYKKREFFWA